LQCEPLDGIHWGWISFVHSGASGMKNR
jgi:hypothetical protein